ncbi:hypothetical protein GCM10027200_07280 [Lentzea nigeriaca]
MTIIMMPANQIQPSHPVSRIVPPLSRDGIARPPWHRRAGRIFTRHVREASSCSVTAGGSASGGSAPRPVSREARLVFEKTPTYGNFPQAFTPWRSSTRPSPSTRGPPRTGEDRGRVSLAQFGSWPL